MPEDTITKHQDGAGWYVAKFDNEPAVVAGSATLTGTPVVNVVKVGRRGREDVSAEFTSGAKPPQIDAGNQWVRFWLRARADHSEQEWTEAAHEVSVEATLTNGEVAVRRGYLLLSRLGNV